MLDGYLIGKVQRIDDVPLNEEENLEAQETSVATPEATSGDLPPLDNLSTQQLLQIGLDFINKGREASEPWLHERILAAYGQPPLDAAIFPYWFACVLPISEEEKYQLLMITSVRGRLNLTANWIRRIETQRWLVLFFSLYFEHVSTLPTYTLCKISPPDFPVSTSLQEDRLRAQAHALVTAGIQRVQASESAETGENASSDPARTSVDDASSSHSSSDRAGEAEA